jgi:DNA end-binding protein Ku
LGIGEIPFSGPEHFVAIGAPLDPKQKGLMLYTLRYEDELRASKSALSGVKESSVDTEELSLAITTYRRQNLEGRSVVYSNDYVAAVKKLVDAKRRGKPLPESEPEPAKSKVANIVDALRSGPAQGNTPKKGRQENDPEEGCMNSCF